MKKGTVLFIAMVFSAIFLAGSSYAWSIGKVRKDEKNKKNFIIEINDFEISPRRPVVEVKVTPSIRPIMLEFFNVQDPADLAGKDREEIKNSPPPLIKFLDEVIDGVRERFYKDRKKIVV
jgi:hypothetical protein